MNQDSSHAGTRARARGNLEEDKQRIVVDKGGWVLLGIKDPYCETTPRTSTSHPIQVRVHNSLHRATAHYAFGHVTVLVVVPELQGLSKLFLRSRLRRGQVTAVWKHKHLTRVSLMAIPSSVRDAAKLQ